MALFSHGLLLLCELIAHVVSQVKHFPDFFVIKEFSLVSIFIVYVDYLLSFYWIIFIVWG